MKARRFDVVVIGSINMDFVALTHKLPGRGETVLGHGFRASPGGKGANQAVAAARLGARTAQIGCVGDDDLGRALRQSLERNGIDCQAVSVAQGHPSGTAVILVDEGGANMIVVSPGGNGELATADIDAAAQLMDEASVIALQLEVPLTTTRYAAEMGHRLGKIVVLNPAPCQPLTDDLLRCVDYLVPNETEAEALSGIRVDSIEAASRAAQSLRLRGARRVLVTLGAQGVVCADERGVTHHAAIQAHAVDTTAAGDTFIGALCCGLASGQPLDWAIRFGQTAAALSVARHGAQDSIPRLEEMPKLDG